MNLAKPAPLRPLDEQAAELAAAKTDPKPSLALRVAHDLLGVIGAFALIYAAVRIALHLHVLH